MGGWARAQGLSLSPVLPRAPSLSDLSWHLWWLSVEGHMCSFLQLGKHLSRSPYLKGQRGLSYLVSGGSFSF